jgi:hypothetical protein
MSEIFSLEKTGNSLLNDRGQFNTDVNLGPSQNAAFGLPPGTVHGFNATHPNLPGIDGYIQPGTASSDFARGMLGAYTDKNIRQANLNKTMEPINIAFGVNKRDNWIPYHSLPYFETALHRNTQVAKTVSRADSAMSLPSQRMRQVFSYKMQNIPMLNYDMQYTAKGHEWGEYRSFTEMIAPMITTCGVQIHLVPEYNKNKISELELEFHYKGFASQVVNVWGSWQDATIKSRLLDGASAVVHGDHVGYVISRYRNTNEWARLFSGTVGEHTNMPHHYHWVWIPHISPTGQKPHWSLYNSLDIDTASASSIAAETDSSGDSGDDFGGPRDMSVSRVGLSNRRDDGMEGTDQYDTDDTSMFDSDQANASADEHGFDLMGTKGHWDVPYKTDQFQGAYWGTGIIRDARANDGGSATGQALVDITRAMVFPDNNGDQWHENYSKSSRVSMILKPYRPA